MAEPVLNVEDAGEVDAIDLIGEQREDFDAADRGVVIALAEIETEVEVLPGSVEHEIELSEVGERVDEGFEIGAGGGELAHVVLGERVFGKLVAFLVEGAFRDVGALGGGDFETGPAVACLEFVEEESPLAIRSGHGP